MIHGWSIKDIAQYYAEYSKDYDAEIDADSYPAPFIISRWVLEGLLSQQPRLKQNPASAPRQKILDIGCGTGQRCVILVDFFGQMFQNSFANLLKSSKIFLEPPHNHFDVIGVDATPEVLLDYRASK
jgi:SAM-dependent methyltransferase